MIHLKRNSKIPEASKSDAIRSDRRKYNEDYKRSTASRSQEAFNESAKGDTIDTLKAIAEPFNVKSATCWHFQPNNPNQ